MGKMAKTTGARNLGRETRHTGNRTSKNSKNSKDNRRMSRGRVRMTFPRAGRAPLLSVDERVAYVAPLFDYCAEHSIMVARVAQRAALRAGCTTMSRTRLWRIKTGVALVPDWFVEGVCREIGQPVEVVMGREWRQRHMAAGAAVSVSASAAVSSAQGATQRQAS